MRAGVWVGYANGHSVELWPRVVFGGSAAPRFSVQVVVDGRDRFDVNDCSPYLIDEYKSVACTLLNKLVAVKDVYYAVWAVRSAASLAGTFIVAAVERAYLQAKDVASSALSKAENCVDDLSCISQSYANMVKAISLTTSAHIHSAYTLQLPDSEREIAFKIADAVARRSVGDVRKPIAVGGTHRPVTDKEEQSLLYVGSIGSHHVYIAPDSNLTPYLVIGTANSTDYIAPLSKNSLDDAVAAIALIAAHEYRMSSGVMYEVATNSFIQDSVVKYVSNNLGAIVGALDDAFIPLYKYMALS
jgi:hypothetical protein